MPATAEPKTAVPVPYAPAWVGPHVTGSYTARVRVPGGGYDEQTFQASCSQCGAVLGPRKCSSGMVRHHIDTFSRLHLHRHPLAAIPRKPA